MGIERMNGWTKNSRFWKVTPWIVLLSAGLAVYFNEPTTFIAVVTPWITLAGGKSIVSTYRGFESPEVDDSERSA